jgi:4-amino-4-deoxy-L-arabinose transferase-like glycosyltransferase
LWNIVAALSPGAASMSESAILDRQRKVVPHAPAATSNRVQSSGSSRSVVSARVLQAVALASFTAGALSVIWVSLGDHALHSNSEGRYASAAETMADGGSWLIPQLAGRPHLTKPPLTYWLEALSLRCFGHDEFAVRFPSALAGSLTALALLAFGWRLGGRKQGILAMGILMLTPLHVTMSRLTLTDSLMGLFWFGILAGGFLCLERPSEPGDVSEPGDFPKSPGSETRPARIWPCALLWVSFALGMLTKAPLSIVPLGCVVVWAIVSGRWRELRRLHPAWGLPLALLPFAAWVALVVRVDPTAPALWYTETIGRAVGTGDHPKPFWFYVPVFLIGLFPASAMMRIPGWHLSWRSAWRTIRDGGPEALWVLAVVLPFLFFSISRGKHFSYILPLGPPLALLSAGILKQLLERPFRGVESRESRVESRRFAIKSFRLSSLRSQLSTLDSRLSTLDSDEFDCRDPASPLFVFLSSLAVVVALAITVTLYDSNDFPLHWLWAPVLLLAVAAGWQWWIWHRLPALRSAALFAVWGVSLAVWYTASELEDVHFNGLSTKRLIERIRRQTGEKDPDVQTLGLTDSTIAFYTHAARTSRGDVLNHPETIGVQSSSRRKVLVAEPKAWRRFAQADPQTARLYRWSWHWDRGRWNHPLIVLFSQPPADESQTSNGRELH